MKKWIVWISIFIPLITNAPSVLTKADSLYEQRSDCFETAVGLGDSSLINEAIHEYKKALTEAERTEKETIIWKLMQCYYYKGNYTTANKEIRKKIFMEGIKTGNEALKEYPDSPGVHFWMCILWGYWSEQVGLFTAGRNGVANKIRDHAETLIRIDDRFADGGAYRTLGRLNFKAPKIPLILNWPSKDKAVYYLGKAYAVNPENLFTKQYYAEALYDSGAKEKALKMMREILNLTGTVHGLAEDNFIRKESALFLRNHPD
jgi:tetratricopeptide (TPR) repeat protein